MIEPYAFAIVAALIVASSFLVFVVKRILHAVIALTLVFIESALVFLLLGQTMLAMLQLFVFVGGLSTYLMVAIAAEMKISRMENVPLLIILAVVFFAGMGAIIFYLPTSLVQQSNSITLAAPQIFQDYYALLYAIALLLFAATIGSALVARRFARLVM